MAGWDGLGHFQRIYSWVADKAAGINITASRMDDDTDAITTDGFNNCLTRDGQGSATANLPMNGFRHTGVGDGTAKQHYTSVNQIQLGTNVFAVAAGTANAITGNYAPNITALSDGMELRIRFTAANSNDHPTFTPNNGTIPAYTITKNGGVLIIGEIQNGLEATLRYVLATTTWELITGTRAAGFETQTSLASAATTDLGSVTTNNVLVTGTTTITSFGSSASVASPIFLVVFAASLILTHNGTSLIIPGGQNIKTVANSRALVEYLGSGNWRVLDYQQSNGQALSALGALTSVASAATADLGAAGSNLIQITGSTTITALGSTASLANPYYKVVFGGAAMLTYNATSLKIPGNADLTPAAGGVAELLYLGSGNWQVLNYQAPNGQSLAVFGGAATLASGATTSLGSAGSNFVSVTGTTTITSFGATASLANPLYVVQFTGTLQVTYDGTAMIIEGGASITTNPNSIAVVQYLGSGNWRWLWYRDANAAQIIHVRDEKTAGTSGGNSTFGSYVQRTLNTTVSNTMANVTLSSNRVNLVPGRYRVWARVPAFASNAHKAKLYNNTAGADLIVGSSAYNKPASGSDGSQSDSIVTGIISLSAAAAVGLIHQVATSETDGLGKPCNFGSDVEVYSEMIIERLA